MSADIDEAQVSEAFHELLSLDGAGGQAPGEDADRARFT